MNGLALFAGIGGLELGLSLAIPTYRTVCYVEREAYAASALVARMEDAALDQAPIWDNVVSFDGKPWAGRVSLVSGGFPCTDISLAGKGAGIEGEHSGLWAEYARIVDETRCRYVFVENVPALTSRGLDRVLGDLADLGFDAEWDCFSAGGVGAPHLRRRIFILAQRVPYSIRNAIRDEPERGAGSALKADDGSPEPRHMGEQVAHRDSLSGRVGARRGNRPQASHSRPEMADPDRPQREGNERPERSKPKRTHVDPQGNEITDLGDTDSGRRERERERERERRILNLERPVRGADPDRYDRRPAWPPGPEDSEGWRRYIEAGGPEPVVRRGADGISEGMVDRSDRLRCLGNGVVPVVAARAFLTLARRLTP